jgi:hypothetical protein
MKRSNKRKSVRPKTKLGLADLEQAKAAVVGSLSSPGSQREYCRSINEFVAWYCSEPRLLSAKLSSFAFECTLKNGISPRSPSRTSGALRRLAYEASDSGLLSPELAAGIRRVKGAKRLGVRLGNWLTQEEARALWQLPDERTCGGYGIGRCWPLCWVISVPVSIREVDQFSLSPHERLAHFSSKWLIVSFFWQRPSSSPPRSSFHRNQIDLRTSLVVTIAFA